MGITVVADGKFSISHFMHIFESKKWVLDGTLIKEKEFIEIEMRDHEFDAKDEANNFLISFHTNNDN